MDAVWKTVYGTPNFLLNTPTGIGHSCNALYAAGFTIEMAMIPFIVKSIGGSVTMTGDIQSELAICQFFGAIIFGRLADSIGPRNSFLLALGSSSIVYASLALAFAQWILAIAVIPAIFMHGFQAAAIIICWVGGVKDRTRSIAYLSLSYATGMVLGGTLSAILGRTFGSHGAMLSALFLTILGMVLTMRLDKVGLNVRPMDTRAAISMPCDLEDNSNNVWHSPRRERLINVPDNSHLFTSADEEFESEEDDERGDSNVDYRDQYMDALEAEDGSSWQRAVWKEITRFIHVLWKSLNWTLLLAASFLPILVTRMAFPPVAVDFYNLSTEQSGWLIVYIGILTLLAEGIVAPILASWFGDYVAMKIAIVVAALGFIPLWVMHPIGERLTLILLFPVIMAGAVLYVVCTSQMTKHVLSSEFGTVLGINGSIFYGVSFLAIPVGVALYTSSGIRLLWFFCFAWMSCISAYVLVVDPFFTKAFSSRSRCSLAIPRYYADHSQI